MAVKKNNGRVLLKLGLVLVVLAVAGVLLFQRLQPTALVKAAYLSDSADAVTGTVNVDPEGLTKKLDSDAAGRVLWCEGINPTTMFKEGEVLVRLDDSELKRAMGEAERQYNSSLERSRFVITGGKPELLADAKNLSDEERERVVRENNPERKLAAERLEYTRRLLKLGDVSEEEVKALERGLEEADRRLKLTLLDEKKGREDFLFAKKNAEIQLEKMEIKAPSDGQIDSALTWKGALISAGQTVATFFSNTRLVTAKISEESFGKVKIGQRARIRLLTYGEQIFDATVSKLHPKADDAQRFTVYFDVKVDDPQTLKPGSTGEVTITVDEKPNSTMIPRRALFDSDKVYVVKGGRVEKRQIKTGHVALNVAQVVEGVAVGEQVIVDRLEEFRGGERVRVESVK